MGRKSIRKYSFAFQLLLMPGSLYHRLFYRKFVVNGRENIPKNTPVIFAGNHQNGLMDPLAIIFAARRQMVFLARADIFRKKIIARLLYFIKILPIYRQRDGFRSVDKNQEVFNESIEALKYGRPVGILPEGNHTGQKRLRPLQKGAARLALSAEENADFKLGLQIVPVGIDYSNYFRPGSDLLVIFGKPIKVDHYKRLYQENQPRAITQLKEELAGSLRKVIIDIRPWEFYRSILTATELSYREYLRINNLNPGLYQAFLAKKHLTEKLNLFAETRRLEMDSLKDLCEEYVQKLDEHNLKGYDLIGKKNHLFVLLLKCFVLILLSPVYLYGLIFNFLPYVLSVKISKIAKDPHLVISIGFGAGFFLFIIWYLILVSITCFIALAMLWKILFIISVPLSGIFSFYFYERMMKLYDHWRWLKIKFEKSEGFKEIIELRVKIISWVLKVTSN